MKNFPVYFLTLYLMFTLLPSCTASAEEFEYYTYTPTSSYEVTITDVNPSISGDVEIPSVIDGYYVTGIGDGAFKDCKSITSITIPEKITSVGNSVFQACTMLHSVVISEGNTSFCIEDDVLYNKDKTTLIYAINRAKTAFTIPDGVTTIAGSAFYGNSELQDINFSDSVKTIGDYAFYNCNAISSINIPGSVTHIGSYSFNGCYASVTLNAGLQYIGEHAFSTSYSKYWGGRYANEVQGFEYITIPDTVTYVGDYAFQAMASTIIVPKSVEYFGKMYVYRAYWYEGSNGPDPSSMEGYTFSIYYKGTKEEWQNISAGFEYEATPYFPDGITAPGKANLYYNYTPECTVTYDANGGENAPESVTVGFGKQITLSTDKLSYPGYKFDGWNTEKDGSGTAYASGSSFYCYGSVTLYAQWKKIHTVLYNANGGSVGVYDQTFIDGQPGVLATDIPEREGYDFLCWNTEKDGSGTAYAPGDSITVYESMTLYAQWKVLYTIHYNANGGTDAPLSQVKEEGVSLTLMRALPSKDGYTFKEWNTKQDGSGTAYAPGAVYTANESVTLYAQWKSNGAMVVSGISFTVTLSGDTDNGSVYAALYDLSGKLKAIKIYPAASTVNVSFALGETGAYAQIMWWDDNMQSMCDVQKIPLQ